MTHPPRTDEPGWSDELSAARDALDGRHDPLDGGAARLGDRAVPNLPSRDFGATIRFYAGFGFEVAFRDGGWLILRRGGVVLEFFLAPEIDPYSSGYMVSIRVADLDDLYDRVHASGIPERSTGIPRLVPVALQEWGQRAGYLVDLDGTQLHLIEDAG